ncbi:HAD family hydrolase [bacterium]|nr:HAD family hydrolase [bacterium]
MIKQVFIDFDGTIVDCKERLYRLFIDLTETNENQLSNEVYWKYKQAGYKQNQMLGVINYQNVEYFTTQWKQRIESKEYLQYDAISEDTKSVLKYLYNRYKLYLVSNRQSKKNLIWQLETLGIAEKFEEVLVTEQMCTKSQLINKMLENGEHAIMIGDTVEDIVEAKKMQLKTICVKSGVVPWREIQEQKPWKMVESLVEIKELI